MNAHEASVVVQRCFRRRKRLAPKNDRCAITLQSIDQIEKVFVKINDAGYPRGYCANALYDYFSSRLDRDEIDDLKWPIDRSEVNSLEIKRLENLLGIDNSRRVSVRKNYFWKQIFKDTLIQSVHEMIDKISNDISGHNADDEDDALDETEIADSMSSLLASMLYLFIISKTKWRSIKNRKLRSGIDRVNLVFEQIKILTTEMNALFIHHDLNLAWSGTSVVPIIIKTVPINCLR